MNVDLQGVSIDPIQPKIRVARQTTVKSFLKNNVGVIPKGEATCHITVNGKYLHKPGNFKSDHWLLEGVKIEQGNYEVFCKSKKQMKEGELTEIAFTVKGKRVGTADITLASSLSGDSKNWDIDGLNQSVRTELIVAK